MILFLLKIFLCNQIIETFNRDLQKEQEICQLDMGFPRTRRDTDGRVEFIYEKVIF